MKSVFSTLMLASLLGTTSYAAEATIPLTGENTKITFVGTKPDGKHEGGFKTLTGTATVDGKDVTTLKIAIEIDMNSTFSDDEKLTGHLKSPDFFGVKDNPKAKFVTTKVEKGDAGYNVTGKLTLCGKTKEVTFPAKIETNGETLSLTSNFKIDRNDWGIKYGKGKIGDDVALAVVISVKK